MEWVRQAILIYEETDFILEELLVQIEFITRGREVQLRPNISKLVHLRSLRVIVRGVRQNASVCTSQQAARGSFFQLIELFTRSLELTLSLQFVSITPITTSRSRISRKKSKIGISPDSL